MNYSTSSSLVLYTKPLKDNGIGKPVSLYDESSNWQHRPLRKAQLHHAALNAARVLQMYSIFKKDIPEKHSKPPLTTTASTVKNKENHNLSVFHQFNVDEASIAKEKDPSNDHPQGTCLTSNKNNAVSLGELLGKSEFQDYIDFKDFQVNPDENILWIDDCENDLFKEITEEILRSHAVAFTGKAIHDISTPDALQMTVFAISTNTKVYVFDAIRLARCPKFRSLFLSLLENKDILKVKQFKAQAIT